MSPDELDRNLNALNPLSILMSQQCGKQNNRFLKVVKSYLVAGLSSVSVCCGESGEVGASSPS